MHAAQSRILGSPFINEDFRTGIAPSHKHAAPGAWPPQPQAERATAAAEPPDTPEGGPGLQLKSGAHRAEPAARATRTQRRCIPTYPRTRTHICARPYCSAHTATQGSSALLHALAGVAPSVPGHLQWNACMYKTSHRRMSALALARTYRHHAGPPESRQNRRVGCADDHARGGDADLRKFKKKIEILSLGHRDLRRKCAVRASAVPCRSAPVRRPVSDRSAAFSGRSATAHAAGFNHNRISRRWQDDDAQPYPRKRAAGRPHRRFRK